MKPKKVLFKKINQHAKMPTRSHEGDAGYDIYAVEDGIIPIHQVVVIPSGINIEMPKGYYAELHPRSSLAMRGVYMKIGILDEGYRGDIGAMVISLKRPMRIKRGQRIAQILFKKRVEVEFEEVEHLSKSDRGKKAFGSTGA